MLVIVVTAGYETSFTCEVENLLQLIDFMQNNQEKTWLEIEDKQLTFTLCKKDGTEAVSLYPGMLKSNIDSYDCLIIAEKLEGQALFTSLIASIAATLAVSTATATAIVTTAVVIGSFVLSYALGQIMQALSPTAEVNGDASQKNYLFNGIPNVKEQGGSVPLFFGEAYFGGVIVGVVLDTLDMSVSGNLIVNDDITTVAKANISTVSKSTWYRAE